MFSKFSCSHQMSVWSKLPHPTAFPLFWPRQFRHYVPWLLHWLCSIMDGCFGIRIFHFSSAKTLWRRKCAYQRWIFLPHSLAHCCCCWTTTTIVWGRHFPFENFLFRKYLPFFWVLSCIATPGPPPRCDRFRFEWMIVKIIRNTCRYFFYHR